MAFTPYLAFAGNCRDAFTRYQEIFGGELVLLPFSVEPGTEAPAELADRVMHAALMTDGALLMGADDPSGNFDGTTSGMCCSVSLPSKEEAARVFTALADDGTVQVPFDATFFSIGFGMCTDSYGTPWMINTDDPNNPSPGFTP